MTNAELIQKIRNEIERQKKYEKELIENSTKKYGAYPASSDIMLIAYQNVLSFLSTLESEKPAPADLEEAAEKWSKENTRGFVLKDKTTRYVGDAIDAFIAGAKWDRSQMLKEAVEGIVHYFGETQGVPRSITIPQMQKWLKPFGNGDKVKLIIIKED